MVYARKAVNLNELGRTLILPRTVFNHPAKIMPDSRRWVTKVSGKVQFAKEHISISWGASLVLIVEK